MNVMSSRLIQRKSIHSLDLNQYSAIESIRQLRSWLKI
nr:MAG TPA: hypothetical protein [Caudoviricetes sp.]